MRCIRCLLAALLLYTLSNAVESSEPKPTSSVPMHHRLAVVIPFRDRERHLKSFLSQANPYIAAQVTEFRVFIVEQDFGEHFNRGLLMNIGFLIAAHRRYDYFSFHDVDMIPINGQDGNTAGPVYKYVTQPTHLATAAEQYKWEMPYAGYCGGVLNLNLADMLTINGFPNRYWGWGAEDDEINLRIDRAGLEVKRRRPLSRGTYKSLAHSKAHGGVELHRQKKLREMEQFLRIDGITNVNQHFTILSVAEDDENNMTRVKVDVTVRDDGTASECVALWNQ